MGDNRTPITQGLRERLKATTLGLSRHMVDGLLAECDNIDAIHKALEDANAEMREFCNRLEDAADKREDVDLWGVSYTALPLDADGVPIHVGDKVTEHEDGHTFKVDGFMDWDGEWWVFMRDGIQAPASRCTHHHAPTVEDVLREFGDWYAHTKGGCDEDGIIAEYAERIREAVRDA